MHTKLSTLQLVYDVTEICVDHSPPRMTHSINFPRRKNSALKLWARTRRVRVIRRVGPGLTCKYTFRLTLRICNATISPLAWCSGPPAACILHTYQILCQLRYFKSSLCMQRHLESATLGSVWGRASAGLAGVSVVR